MTNATATQSRTAPTATFAPIKWLFAIDAAYRQSCDLKKAGIRQLKDMGITREQANQPFLQQFSQNRFYSKSRA